LWGSRRSPLPFELLSVLAMEQPVGKLPTGTGESPVPPRPRPLIPHKPATDYLNRSRCFAWPARRADLDAAARRPYLGIVMAVPEFPAGEAWRLPADQFSGWQRRPRGACQCRHLNSGSVPNKEGPPWQMDRCHPAIEPQPGPVSCRTPASVRRWAAPFASLISTARPWQGR